MSLLPSSFLFFWFFSPDCVMSAIFFQCIHFLFLLFIFQLLPFYLFPSIFCSSSPHYSTFYRYNFSNPSFIFFTLLLPIFFAISLYHYFFSNLLYIYIYNFFFFLFPINLVLLPLYLSLPSIPLCLQKKAITSILSFDDFISCNFNLGLGGFMFSITLL